IGEHAPGDGEWYTCIEGASTNVPAVVGQDYNLVGDLYRLPAGLTCRDDTQHIAILGFNVLGAVILSAAKDLFVRRARSFAALRMTGVALRMIGVALRMTGVALRMTGVALRACPEWNEGLTGIGGHF